MLDQESGSESFFTLMLVEEAAEAGFARMAASMVVDMV